jgi:hypothetical protein
VSNAFHTKIGDILILSGPRNGAIAFFKMADQFGFIRLSVPACSALIFSGQSTGAGKIGAGAGPSQKSILY